MGGLTAGEINILIKARDQASRVMGRIGQAGGAMGQAIRRGAMIAAAALLAMSVASGVMAVKFDASMTKIITLVGISAERVAEMREEVLLLAGETARAPQELAEALFVVTSAGARGAEAMEILERSAQAAALGLGETKDIARTVTAAMQAYAKEGLTAAEATATLFATVREGNLEAADLSNSLGRVLGIAAQVGVSFDELGAFVATFTRLGVSAEEAVTSLRGVLNTLINPSTQAEEALAEASLTLADLRRQVEEEGLLSVLQLLMERFGGNIEVLAAIIPNIRALSGVLGTVGAQGETYIGVLANMAEAQAEFDEAVLATAATPAFKLQQALANLKVQMVEIGSEALPAVAAGLTEVTTAIRDVGPKLVAEIREWKPLIEETGAVIRDMFTFITQNEATIIAAIAAIGAAIVLAFGPLSAAALALAGIVVAVGLFRTEIDDLSPAMVDMERAILENIATLGKWITVGSVAAAVALALTGNLAGALGALGLASGAAVAVIEAEKRLDELGPAIERVRSLAGAAEQTFIGLKKALDDTTGSYVRVIDATGKLGFVLPRTTVEAKLLKLAMEEVANEGPNAAAALEVLTAHAIASGQSFRSMTIEMLQTTAAMQAMAEQWTATSASIQGFGTSPDVQAAIDRLMEFSMPAAAPPPPPLPSPAADIGEAVAAATEEAFDHAAFLVRQGMRDWLATVEAGVRAGTITIQTAFDFLSRGMEDAGRTIIDALAAQEREIERVWAIIAATIERGVVRFQDIRELMDLGAFGQEVADDFIAALRGESSRIGDTIFEAAEEAAREAAEEAAAAFVEAFEAGIADLESTLGGMLGTLQGIAGGPSVESVTDRIRMLELEQQRLELVGPAEEARAARLEALAAAEEQLAEARKPLAALTDKIAEHERNAAKIREDIAEARGGPMRAERERLEQELAKEERRIILAERMARSEQRRFERMQRDLGVVEDMLSEEEKQLLAVEEEIAALQALAEARQIERDLVVLRAQLLEASLPTEAELLDNLAEQVKLWGALNDVFGRMEQGIFDVTDAAILMQAGLLELALLLLQINAGLVPAPAFSQAGVIAAGSSPAVLLGRERFPPLNQLTAGTPGPTVVNNYIKQVVIQGDPEETLRGLGR